MASATCRFLPEFNLQFNKRVGAEPPSPERIQLKTNSNKEKEKVWLSLKPSTTAIDRVTLVPVAGSLVGSVLCFLHGCYLLVESFLDWYGGDDEENNEDGGETMRGLVESVDMYLLGYGMLNFGFGLYVVFVSCSGRRRWRNQIGRALVMMLQSGTIEKLKNIPMVTAVDLVCIAGALFISSAALLILSKLDRKKKKGGCVFQ